MPDGESAIGPLAAAAMAERARIDARQKESALAGDTNREFVRQFKTVPAAAAPGSVPSPPDATARAQRWPPALAAIWTGMLVVATAKVAVAAWGVPAVVASEGMALRLPFAVTLLLFGLTGALFVVGGASDPRLRSLGAFFIVIASAFANPLTPYVDGGFLGACISELRRLPTDAFLPLTFWLFVRAFPSEPTLHLPTRVAGGFVAASACMGTLVFATNAWLAHTAAARGPAPVAALLRVLDRDAPTLAYWPLLFALTGAALPYLVWKLRFETIEARQRGAVLIIGLVAGITPILVTVAATPFVPALREPSLRHVVGWVLYGALISVIPSTAYAVIVRRVMDVHLILRKTSQHALARYVVWLASLAPLTYLFFNTEVRRQPTLLLVPSLLGFGALLFRERLLRGVDGWFLRGAVDYAEALARVERGLRDARSVRESALLLAHEIERTMHPMSIAIFAVDDSRHQLVPLHGTSRPLSTHSVLAELLGQSRRDIQFDPQPDGAIARLLPPPDRAWLVDAQLTLLSPMIDSSGRLLGIIGMGDSRGGLPYTKQDRMFITNISGHAAMQLENRWLQGFADDGHDSTHPRGAVAIDWDKEPAAHCPDCSTLSPGNVRMCACGTPTVPAALPMLVNGKFRLERLLGSGGMGVVYLAVDVTLDRKVAIKTLPKVTPDRVAWLQREARTMASVLHPNLALIYGAEEWRGTTLLVVEYLEGGTLAEHLGRGLLEIPEVVDLGIVLADVLDRVHASGVLHRDIKPSNIAYTRDGIPKLLDFGVAAIVDCSPRHDDRPPAPAGASKSVADDIIGHALPRRTFVSSTQRLMGTPLYLSPEAVAGEAPHPSFDLWSLSLVLYEAVTEHHPFDAESVADVIKRIQRTQVADVRDFRPDCPAELAALLRDSLSPVLIRRPASATDLRVRLQRLRAGLSTAIS